jgi:hypothetical protein
MASYGIVCGILGTIGAAAYLAIDTFQGHRVGRFGRSWLLGDLSRSRPSVFWLAASMRWILIAASFLVFLTLNMLKVN